MSTNSKNSKKAVVATKAPVKSETPKPSVKAKAKKEEVVKITPREAQSFTAEEAKRLSKTEIIPISTFSNELRAEIHFFDKRVKDVNHYIVKPASNSKYKEDLVAKISSARKDKRVNDYYCTMTAIIGDQLKPIHKLTSGFVRPATEAEIKAFEKKAKEIKEKATAKSTAAEA